MSDLRDAFRDAVEDVEAPGLAAEAWEEAQVRRVVRRRGVAGGAVLLAAALVAVLVLAPFGRTGGPDPTAAGPSSSADPSLGPPTSQRSGWPVPEVVLQGAPVWPAPDLVGELRLSELRTLLGAQVGAPPVDAPDLAAEPTERAVLVAASKDAAGATRLAVLGRDGGWRTVPDLALRPVRDRGGNSSWPLRAGSVSPDGTRVALPQPGSVVVLDVTTGRHRSWPVGVATNESVAWTSDGRVRVHAEGSGKVLDPATGTVADEPAQDVFGIAGDVSFARDGGGTQVLRTLSGDRPLAAQDLEWWGYPAVSGDRVARAFFGREVLLPDTGAVLPQGIAVVDTGTGDLAAVFEVAGEQRYKGCCPVARWLDPVWVAYVSESRRIVALNTRTGEAALVTRLWADGSDGQAVALGAVL